MPATESGRQLHFQVRDTGIGIPADRIEAAHWLLRSADQGNELADAYLKAKVGMRDLPPNELEEAKRRAGQPLPPPTASPG